MTSAIIKRLHECAQDNGAVLFVDPQGVTTTYAAAAERSAQFANTLSDLDVNPGDRVAVMVEKSQEALLLYLAVLRAGAVFLPMNPDYTSSEVSYFLADAKPHLFVVKPEDLVTYQPLAQNAGVPHVLTLGTMGEGTFIDMSISGDTVFEDAAVAEDDLAAILYTSGTTGRSKGAMLTHGNLASNAATLAQYWAYTASDRLLHALPIFHTHGLFVGLNVTITAGASLILLPKFDIDEVTRLLPGSTVLMGVPTFYSRLLAHDGFTRGVAQNIRLFISGSAPLLPEVHKRFSALTGKDILERYGMTETNMIASNPYDGQRRAGTVGYPLPGIEVRITDPGTETELPNGDIGMIEVRGPNVFKGYWNMPKKTKEELRENGFLITGDLGAFDEAGYLRILGRDKDLIISGGYNVYPAEIEGALSKLEGIADCAVIGVGHPDFGEAVVALVVTDNPDQFDETQVRPKLKSQLANYKIPKKVLELDELPKNKMGKIQKKQLREAYKDLFAGDA